MSDELHRAADKFFSEVDFLEGLIEQAAATNDPTQSALTLSQTKRTQRALKSLLRTVAARHDTLK